ncbi:MAG: undecaprenyl-diphosphatase UppP [Candidatus Pacebacteria bacterium]|nr:undecaprenyl-diphosphatase UppP [Candidatus Paceibacterota bacterium]
MPLFDAVILGIVEGVTEFLPISSTGHLILANTLLGIPHTDFTKSFEIAIQVGAMCAVVALYLRSFFDIEILKRLIVGFVPTAIVGFTVYPYVKAVLLGSPLVVVGALFVGGIVLIVFEMLKIQPDESRANIATMPYLHAALIGLAQSVAVIPGVSRSAATIIGGLALKMPRAAIVEFSFLLAVPTIAAATALDLLKSYSAFTAADMAPLAVGFIVSFVVALVSLRYLLQYVRNHTFIAFGVYRIAVAILFFFFVL